MAAYVYLIEEESFQGEMSGPWTKIGDSENRPDWRLLNLKQGNPRNLLIKAAFEYDSVEEVFAAEQAAHEAFLEHLHQKEWFKIPWQQVSEWFLHSGAKIRSEDEWKP